MAEYIERAAVLNKIRALQKNDPATVGKKQFSDGYFCGLDESEIIAMQIPAADVVEPVRCGMCELFKNEDVNFGLGCCGRYRRTMHNTDFCSYGQRRQNNG